MAEPKYRYRIPPCPAYDIPATEDWLEDMAAKGLHLSKDGFFGFFTTFEEGPPKKERFRLEPTTTKGGLFSREYDPEDDAVQMLRQMGWTYRARRGQFFVYSADDPQAPELNTDPQVQAVTMTALTRYLGKNLCSTLLMTLLYILLFFGNTLLTLTIGLGSWRVGLLALLLLWDLGRRFTEFVTLSRFRRRLQRGLPLPHRSSRRREVYLIAGGVRKTLWVVLICAMLARILPLMTQEPYIPLSDHTAPLPFATVQTLHPGAEVTRVDGILENRIYAWSDPLAPENYDFSEYAEVTLEGQTFDCYLTVQYHRTRWEWPARALAREYISQAGLNLRDRIAIRFFGAELDWIETIVLPDADFCACYYKRLPEPWLILQKDNVVVKVRLAFFSETEIPEPEALARMILSHIQ